MCIKAHILFNSIANAKQEKKTDECIPYNFYGKIVAPKTSQKNSYPWTLYASHKLK
jgi:hypothetical protein